MEIIAEWYLPASCESLRADGVEGGTRLSRVAEERLGRSRHTSHFSFLKKDCSVCCTTKHRFSLFTCQTEADRVERTPVPNTTQNNNNNNKKTHAEL